MNMHTYIHTYIPIWWRFLYCPTGRPPWISVWQSADLTQIAPLLGFATCAATALECLYIHTFESKYVSIAVVMYVAVLELPDMQSRLRTAMTLSTVTERSLLLSIKWNNLRRSVGKMAEAGSALLPLPDCRCSNIFDTKLSSSRTRSSSPPNIIRKISFVYFPIIIDNMMRFNVLYMYVCVLVRQTSIWLL